jgi:hypothetical protein
MRSQLGAQVHVAQPTDHRLVGVGVALHLEAGVFQFKFVQNFKQTVFVAFAFGVHRQPLHGQRKLQGFEVNVVFVMGIVQHAVKLNVVHLGHGTDVAGHQAGHFHVVFALQAVQVRHLERPLARAHKQLRVFAHGALVHTEHPQLADEGVHHHLEHVGQHMQAHHRAGSQRLAVGRQAHLCRTVAGCPRPDWVPAWPVHPAIAAHRRRCGPTQTRIGIKCPERKRASNGACNSCGVGSTPSSR